MSRIRLLLISFFLIGLLLVSGLGSAVYLFGRATPAGVPPEPVRSVDLSPEVRTGRLLLKDLQSIDVSPYECTLSFSGDSNLTEGTAFIDGSRLRVDALTMGGVVESIIINQNKAVHFLQSVQTEQQTWDITDTSVTTPVLFNETVGYSCRPWVVDASVFATPDTVIHSATTTSS